MTTAIMKHCPLIKVGILCVQALFWLQGLAPFYAEFCLTWLQHEYYTFVYQWLVTEKTNVCSSILEYSDITVLMFCFGRVANCLVQWLKMLPITLYVVICKKLSLIASKSKIETWICASTRSLLLGCTNKQ